MMGEGRKWNVKSIRNYERWKMLKNNHQTMEIFHVSSFLLNMCS